MMDFGYIWQHAPVVVALKDYIAFEIHIMLMRFQVITVVFLKILIIWDVMLSLSSSQSFDGSWCFL
jgi:hypothetical protein